jgi:hypothetical protein
MWAPFFIKRQGFFQVLSRALPSFPDSNIAIPARSQAKGHSCLSFGSLPVRRSKVSEWRRKPIQRLCEVYDGPAFFKAAGGIFNRSAACRKSVWIFKAHIDGLDSNLRHKTLNKRFSDVRIYTSDNSLPYKHSNSKINIMNGHSPAGPALVSPTTM